MKALICLVSLLSATVLIQYDAEAAGLFRSIRDRDEPTPTPAPPPAPTPTPVPDPTPQLPDPTPTPTPPPTQGSLDVFNDVAFPVGDDVDSYYSNYQELLPTRDDRGAHQTDSCRQELDGQNSFADRIAYFVYQHTKSTRAHLAHLAPYYSVPSSLSAHTPTSLTSHRMCRVSAQTLSHTIGSGRVPSSTVIQKLNTFADRYNSLRGRIIDGDQQAEVEMNQLWSKFMSCLAYTESLTTADNSSSERVASKYAPSGYRKPAGVKFYEDPLQNEASRLNIGLFQFTPTGSGNINPCLRHWNELNPNCAVSTGSSRAELIRVVGSNLQSFNAFCGVNKIQQTFAIQVNTSKTSSTHPENFSGGMKSPGQRCVTPFFLAGRAYNHFGPLQNSTGKNLDSLMTCALR